MLINSKIMIVYKFSVEITFWYHYNKLWWSYNMSIAIVGLIEIFGPCYWFLKENKSSYQPLIFLRDICEILLNFLSMKIIITIIKVSNKKSNEI